MGRGLVLGILMLGPAVLAQSKNQIPGSWDTPPPLGATGNQWQNWAMTTPTIGGGRYHHDTRPDQIHITPGQEWDGGSDRKGTQEVNI